MLAVKTPKNTTFLKKFNRLHTFFTKGKIIRG